jgi:hypothetical protein
MPWGAVERDDPLYELAGDRLVKPETDRLAEEAARVVRQCQRDTAADAQLLRAQGGPSRGRRRGGELRVPFGLDLLDQRSRNVSRHSAASLLIVVCMGAEGAPSGGSARRGGAGGSRGLRLDDPLGRYTGIGTQLTGERAVATASCGC